VWATPPDRVNDAPPPAVSAMAAVVLDEASCAVLFDKDSDMHLAPASLTKIATALVAVQGTDLAATVTSDVDSRTMRGSTVMGLVPGDQFSLRDMLAGLLLPSGNDAALAIGRFVAGSDAAFVAQMNTLVAQLGLHDTHFANPHGLGGNGHYSSAYDLAVLARDLMSEPALAQIAGSTQWTARGSRSIQLGTLNGLLYTYSGADGVKTGYTRQAGRTLVASAMRDGHRLYVVLLNDQQRELDARRLLDWAFATFQWAGNG
jgi:D-alanyl-D-alanine carboxypeptidase